MLSNYQLPMGVNKNRMKKEKINFPAFIWSIISFGSGASLILMLYLLSFESKPSKQDVQFLGVILAIIWGFSTILHYLKSKDE